MVVQLAVVALALSASTLIAREYLLTRLDDRIDREIMQEIDELQTLASTGVDPVTGDPFDDPRRLMRVNLQRNIPEPNETMLSVVDGVADSRVAQEPPLRLDLEPSVVGTFAASTTSQLRELETEMGTVRYSAVPVEVSGVDTRGVFVVAVFRDREQQEVNDVTWVLLLAGGLGMLLAASAAWVVAGRVLAPVRLVRRTAEAISGSDLTRRIEFQGADEVAELAGTFNQMLDRLEDAFGAQREFVDDAGHELRTPITIIRGNLETMGEDPEIRRAAMTVVMDELNRMSRMVDDLLTLAKAGRPDFMLPEQVELSELTAGIVSRCRAMGDRSWETEAVGVGWFAADPQRLTQAALQLAQNAVQHTAAGGRVGVGSRLADDVIELWVHDDGPGVPEEDKARIFDRFTRGSGARRSPDGAGLGLAIVRSIAEAHGGSVHLDNAAHGARFRIAFPATGGE